MLVSFKHKFIFIKPRKCGGTSVEAALQRVLTNEQDFRHSNPELVNNDLIVGYRGNRRFFLPKYYNHQSLSEVQKNITKIDYKNFSIVSIMRNPIEKNISLYFFLLFTGNLGLKKYIPNQIRKNLNLAILPMPTTDHLNGFMDWISQGGGMSDYSKFLDSKNRIGITHWLDYEHLNESTNHFLKALSLETIDLPHFKRNNPSKTKNLFSNINQSDSIFFNSLFADELQLFLSFKSVQSK